MSAEDEKQAQIDEENRCIRRLRILTDLVKAVLAKDPTLSIEEAVALIRQTRNAVMRAFPGKDSAYEIIYAPKFERILKERFGEKAVEILHGSIH